jgi:glycosyltransferase involved in cell wall biosynthesis
MHIFTNPSWLKAFAYPYENYEQIPPFVFDEINRDLDKRISEAPLVSIIIPAWNEEVNLLRTVATLSKLKTNIPFEIVVVNNNSKDRTQDTIDHLHVRGLFQPVQGCGPSRQLAQENARGKYVLMADADCFYPAEWMTEMIQVLEKPGVVCVYGRYSFISEPGYPRWQLALLGILKDIMTEIRHFKRPYLSAYGLNFGYIKEYGLKVGFVTTDFRGEDGKLCYDLMQFGKIAQVRSNKARPWTGTRTLRRDGGFWKAFWTRIIMEIKRFSIYFNTRMKQDPNSANVKD